MEDTNTSNMNFGVPPQKKNSKKTAIWAVVAILALVLGGLGGYAWGQYNKNEEVKKAKETAKHEAAKKAEKQEGSADKKTAAPAKTVTEPTCNADELSLEVVDSAESGAGTLAYDLVLTNMGKRSCALGGFPGVSLVNANGNMIGSPAERAANYAEKTLTLAPNAKVKAVMSISNSTNFDAGQCKDGATKLRVYPPNDTGYLSVATSVTSWCPGFEISPVLAM